jgi:hypothetical protein
MSFALGKKVTHWIQKKGQDHWPCPLIHIAEMVMFRCCPGVYALYGPGNASEAATLSFVPNFVQHSGTNFRTFHPCH